MRKQQWAFVAHGSGSCLRCWLRVKKRHHSWIDFPWRPRWVIFLELIKGGELSSRWNKRMMWLCVCVCVCVWSPRGHSLLSLDARSKINPRAWNTPRATITVWNDSYMSKAAGTSFSPSDHINLARGIISRRLKRRVPNKGGGSRVPARTGFATYSLHTHTHTHTHTRNNLIGVAVRAVGGTRPLFTSHFWEDYEDNLVGKHMTLTPFGGKADGRRGTETGRRTTGRGRAEPSSERRQDLCGDIWSWRRTLALLR